MVLVVVGEGTSQSFSEELLKCLLSRWTKLYLLIKNRFTIIIS